VTAEKYEEALNAEYKARKKSTSLASAKLEQRKR
jgi:hypothetical protein